MVTEPVARLWGKLAGVEVEYFNGSNQWWHYSGGYIRVPDPATAEDAVAWMEALGDVRVGRLTPSGLWRAQFEGRAHKADGPTLLDAFAAAIEKLAEGEAGK